jgi:hypothetical protein
MRPLIVFASVWFVLTVGLALLPDDVSFAAAIFPGIPLLIAWVAFTVWSFVIAAKSFRRMAWPSALLCLAFPFAVPLAAYEAIPYVQYPIDYARFQTMRPSYDAQIARLPKSGERYAEFNWGGMLFASRGVVYDETDEVALPYGRQSAAWKSRMKGTDLTCGGDGPVGKVMPLGGHYYVTGFDC